ncbi:MAG: response regulator [Syntrophobacter sp.]
MNILVVDDETDQVETLGRGLRSRGHRVYEATNPREALNLIRGTSEIDMVITDYVMPMMNGIELLEEIRRIRPSLMVILVTAYGQKGLLAAASQRNCNGYLEKPFTPDQLMREIGRVEQHADSTPILNTSSIL